jgi:hypothetical protein
MTAGARFAKWGLGLFIFGARHGLALAESKGREPGELKQ